MTPMSSRFLVNLHKVSAALYPANPPPTTRTRFGKSLYGLLSHGSYLGPVRNARRTISAAAAPPPTASAPLSNPFIAPSAPASRLLLSGGAGPASRRDGHGSIRLLGLGRLPVQAPLQQEVQAVEDDSDQQQDPPQPQNGDVVYGLVDQERRGDHGTEDGKHRRGAEVLMPDLVAAQHEDGDVDHHERYEEQDDGGAAQEGGQDARTLLELECPPRVAHPGGERHYPDKDDEDEARDLDQRQDDVDPDRLGDPVEVDGPDQDHEDERGAYDRYAYELRQVVATEREGEGARRGDTGRHHRERHHEADERVPEGVVDVGGGPARPRVLGDELGVGGGREDREHERAEKGRPDGAPYYAPDLANQRVDPRPDYVSQNEEQQQPRPYASL